MSKLNKALCRRCFNDCARITGNWFYAWDKGNSEKSDNFNWDENGIVYCVGSGMVGASVGFIHIDTIPDFCRYKLEQIVLSEKPQ